MCSMITRSIRDAVKPPPRRGGNTGPVRVPIDDPADPGWRTTSTSPTSSPGSAARVTSSSSPKGRSAIERLLQSDHRVRSVLVSSQRYWPASRRCSTSSTAPVYVAAAGVLEAIVGFDLHRGAIAAADRRPLPALRRRAAGGATHRRARGAQRSREPRCDRPHRHGRSGSTALVLDPTCIDPYYRRTVRVSMGEILFIPVARAADLPAPGSTCSSRRLRGLGPDTAIGDAEPSGVAGPRPVGACCSAPRGPA